MKRLVLQAILLCCASSVAYGNVAPANRIPLSDIALQLGTGVFWNGIINQGAYAVMLQLSFDHPEAYRQLADKARRLADGEQLSYEEQTSEVSLGHGLILKVRLRDKLIEADKPIKADEPELPADIDAKIEQSLAPIREDVDKILRHLNISIEEN